MLSAWCYVSCNTDNNNKNVKHKNEIMYKATLLLWHYMKQITPRQKFKHAQKTGWSKDFEYERR